MTSMFQIQNMKKLNAAELIRSEAQNEKGAGINMLLFSIKIIYQY